MIIHPLMHLFLPPPSTADVPGIGILPRMDRGGEDKNSKSLHLHERGNQTQNKHVISVRDEKLGRKHKAG